MTWLTHYNIEYANLDDTESRIVVEGLALTSSNNTQDSPHELSVIMQQKDAYADAVTSHLVLENTVKGVEIPTSTEVNLPPVL